MVVSERRRVGVLTVEAMVKLRVNGELVHTAAEGDGPVNALDQALRKALAPHYPAINDVHLSDYKVRILDPRQDTKATTRVLIEAARNDDRWCTVGCHRNIIEASFQALCDSLELFLLREQASKSPDSKSPDKSPDTQ
jgi:2-isopropylmalate synthase